jgi:hypothetical protein
MVANGTGAAAPFVTGTIGLLPSIFPDVGAARLRYVLDRRCSAKADRRREGGMGNLQVNRERLWASLMALGEIGATPKGGVCRLAASDLDGEARRRFIQWCKEAGCSVSVDRIGNIFARRPPSEGDRRRSRHLVGAIATTKKHGFADITPKTG